MQMLSWPLMDVGAKGQMMEGEVGGGMGALWRRRAGASVARGDKGGEGARQGLAPFIPPPKPLNAHTSDACAC